MSIDKYRVAAYEVACQVREGGFWLKSQAVRLDGLADKDLAVLARQTTFESLERRYGGTMAHSSRKEAVFKTSRWTGMSEYRDTGRWVRVDRPGDFEKEWLQATLKEWRALKALKAKQQDAVKSIEMQGTAEEAVLSILKIDDNSPCTLGELQGFMRRVCVVETPVLDEIEEFLVEGDPECRLELRQHPATIATWMKFLAFPGNREKYKKKIWGELGWDY